MMNNQIHKKFSVTAALAALCLLLSVSAGASTINFSDCSEDISDAVSPSLNCTIATEETQDFLNPPTVNKEPGFFDITDWKFNGKLDTVKVDGADTYVDNSSRVTFSNFEGLFQSGDWALTEAGKLVDDLMFVFKGGNNDLVGYLIGKDGGFAGFSGTFATPFGRQDTSHISVYYRGESTPVPAPAPLVLLGAGLLGLALVRRRRRGH